MDKFFRLAFGVSGDRAAVPDAADAGGLVSYTQGYPVGYQLIKTDPAAKFTERDKMNQILYSVTLALQELQSQGVPDFISTALNGGAAYSYAINSICRYSSDIYTSLTAANTAIPTDLTKWALLPTATRLQTLYNLNSAAGGTADALTGTFLPAPTAWPASGTQLFFVRAGSANITTTPTFTANSGTLTAKTIVKDGNTALAKGDIWGAGHWLILLYDVTLDKVILLNPASDASPALPQNYRAGMTLANNAGTPNTQVDIAAGRVRDSTNAVNLILAATLTKILQNSGSWAAGSVANGLFTGARANSTWYHVFVIRKDSDGTIDGGFDTSITAANKPSGYTEYRRLGSVLTDGSGNIITFLQTSNIIEWKATRLDVSVTAPGTGATTATMSLPPGLKTKAMLHLRQSITLAAAGDNLLVSDPDLPAETPVFSNSQIGLGAVASAAANCYAEVLCNTSSQLRYQASVGATGTAVALNTRGWIDPSIGYGV